MPIYEYRCSACNKKFDLLRPMSQAADQAECPKCKGQAARIVSGFMAKGQHGPLGGGACASCHTFGGCSSCH